MRFFLRTLYTIPVLLLSCSGLSTDELLDAKFLGSEPDLTPPELLSARAEAGSNELILTFNENVFAVDAPLATESFLYKDFSLGGAAAIVGILDADGTDAEFRLELDLEVATEDNLDQIQILAGMIRDAAGNKMELTTGTLGISFTAPELINATTMDADGDLILDHYKLEFSTDMIDVSFPGYNENSTGFVQSSWMVDGSSVGVVLAHGLAAPETDIADDNILYLQFIEGNSPNTGMLPDLTTAGSSGLLDFDPSPLEQIMSSTVVESDGVAPVLVTPAGLVGSNELELTFSEPVFAVDGGAIKGTSFGYSDDSAGNAGSIQDITDADGSDGTL